MKKLQQKRTATQVIIAYAHNVNLTFFHKWPEILLFMLKNEKEKILWPSRKNLESEDPINGRKSKTV